MLNKGLLGYKIGRLGMDDMKTDVVAALAYASKFLMEEDYALASHQTRQAARLLDRLESLAGHEYDSSDGDFLSFDDTEQCIG